MKGEEVKFSKRIFFLIVTPLSFFANADEIGRGLKAKPTEIALQQQGLSQSDIEQPSSPDDNDKAIMLSEISYLLNFVKNTNCEYERNGKKHKGKEAAKHIKKKYDYYEEDISSTEEFIELSASKSSMSGKAYKIHCANKAVINSQDWLLNELAHFRNLRSERLSDKL
jgi:hypothetical protein